MEGPRRGDIYESPLGNILLAEEEGLLVGLWFEGQKGAPEFSQELFPLAGAAREWLDLYFAGKMPGEPPPLLLKGTPFQRKVWEELQTIPYGSTLTYGDLAERLGSSPRAVGGAVGKNPISLMILNSRVGL